MLLHSFASFLLGKTVYTTVVGKITDTTQVSTKKNSCPSSIEWNYKWATEIDAALTAAHPLQPFFITMEDQFSGET